MHQPVERDIVGERDESEQGPVQDVAADKPSRFHRFFGRYVFSSLTQRIVFLNFAGLIVFVSGILFLNQFRDSLIEARVESLMTQGEIIAGAIAAQATVETDSLTIDPERLLELQAGETAFPMQSETESLDFPINPEQVAPVLRRLISPTRTRARIYDRDGLIILDSARLYSRGQILRYPLEPLDRSQESWLERSWTGFKNWLLRSDLPIYQELPDGNGTGYEEVVAALTGSAASRTRRTADGDTIVSVAVPVQRFRAVLGVLLLSTEAGDIDKIIRDERLAILRTFLVAAIVTLVLSVLLASTIAKPLHRLSAAAERVRLGIRTREKIPDFSARQDEIGLLSVSLRDMTEALYRRIEAIERFAADVSHELKNPLTSLRSAVETLPLAKRDEQKARLLEVINHDVQRLDRLISDISDASRLDAELAREDTESIDLAALAATFVANFNSAMGTKGDQTDLLHLHVADPDRSRVMHGRETRARTRRRRPYRINGHEGRLLQVLANLVNNARSFIPPQAGRIDIRLSAEGEHAVLRVEDNGPGIPPKNTRRIFERFYTDRPQGDAFGQNSGLGLSISQQIVEAHGGEIVAGNITGPDGSVRGARFTIRLPLAPAE